MKPSKTLSTATYYSVSYGPKRERDREWKHFLIAEEANLFFNKKQQDGFWVDAYEMVTTTTTTIRKLTK